jgi:hypothetical protein
MAKNKNNKPKNKASNSSKDSVGGSTKNSVAQFRTTAPPAAAPEAINHSTNTNDNG